MDSYKMHLVVNSLSVPEIYVITTQQHLCQPRWLYKLVCWLHAFYLSAAYVPFPCLNMFTSCLYFLPLVLMKLYHQFEGADLLRNILLMWTVFMQNICGGTCVDGDWWLRLEHHGSEIMSTAASMVECIHRFDQLLFLNLKTWTHGPLTNLKIY